MGRLSLLALLLLVGGCASSPSRSSLYQLEKSILFQPHPFPPEEELPGDAEFENVWFESDDGTRLHGWFCPAKDPVAVVLYCHGNAGNISHRRPLLPFYRDELNASIFLFDYRGYGKSEGTPSEEGILADARAARRWLAKRTGVNEKDIVIVGNSLGGGVAVDLAANDGARGLVLENTFTSLRDVAASHSRLLPLHWMMRSRLDSAAKIAGYHGPLLQTHGTADEVVPFDLGKELFDTANHPKLFANNFGAGHNDPLATDYLVAQKEFFANLPPVPREKPAATQPRD